MNGRLRATIAAPEAIRLDLLRLDTGTTPRGRRTEHLMSFATCRAEWMPRDAERGLGRPAVRQTATPSGRLAPEPTPV